MLFCAGNLAGLGLLWTADPQSFSYSSYYLLWLVRIWWNIYSSLVFSKLNQLLASEDDPCLAINCNNIVDCDAGGVLSPGSICSFTFYFSHEFFSSHAILTCGVLTMYAYMS